MIDVTQINPEARFAMMREIVTNAFEVDEGRCQQEWSTIDEAEKSGMSNEQIYSFIAQFLVSDPTHPIRYAKSKLSAYFAA